MPPIQKITIEMILEHAFKIAEELHQATFDYAGNKFVQEILAFENQPDFLQILRMLRRSRILHFRATILQS